MSVQKSVNSVMKSAQKLVINKLEKNERASDKLSKKAVKDMNVLDTGKTQKHTGVKVMKRKYIGYEIKTAWKAGDEEGFYPVFPFTGTGTSRGHGARNWLLLAKAYIKKQLKLR